MEGCADELRSAYASAAPFPHIVIDDAITPDVFTAAKNEFPPIDTRTWTNWVHLNSRKYGNTHADSWPPTLRLIAQTLTSDRFVKLLDRLTGFEGLLADWSMDGGGLHQSTTGGFLNVHADFTSHHTHDDWRRRVNLLLYFNDEWDESWGGALELWLPDMTRCAKRIAPIGNRMMVFTTSETSFHGHPDPMRCPPDVARRSMALYFFVQESHPPHHATNYRARPGDGARRVGIFLDKHALRVYDRMKRTFRLPDDAVSRLLGFVSTLR